MIEDDNQFLEVTALGSELAWRVMKLWMKSAGRTLNNYQESFTSSADFFADYFYLRSKALPSDMYILLLLNSTEMGEGFHTAIKNQTYTVQTHGKNMTDVYG